MGDLNWENIETIIDEALDRPKDECYEFVETRCAHNQQLKGKVTQLLESIFDSEGWLEDLQDSKYEFYEDISNDIESLTSSHSFLDQEVGSYTIKEQIGQGGMGLVYLAERSDGVFEHQVAIKIIRQSHATKTNIRRFKREQRILAGLNHAGIAQLFDGGITDDGYPYIIMEYVNGTPIHEYCKQNNCSIEEKIDLFKQAIEAVGYAHENLVIHRDLKPDNILVDDSGVVKILDFGISKLLEDEDNLSLTQTGARILTPKYAAPEQIKETNITTATDLYSLGIIFYELLSEVPPFDLEDLSRYKIEQIILDHQPAKPSHHVSSPRLSKKLKGDLDAIVLKAIRKEPEQRYRVAKEFIEDLNRYLKGLPVSARAGSFHYRSKKFFGRHKQGLSIAGAIGFLLIVFSGFYTWKIAEERNHAQLEAQKAQEVTEFLVDMYRASNPMYETDRTITAIDLLERGEDRVDQLEGQPAIQAQLLGVMGKAYERLAKFDKAESLFIRSLELRKQLNSSSHPDIAEGLGSLAVLNRKIGNFAVAESLHNKALTIRESSLGKFHIKTSESLNDLGVILSAQGKYEESNFYLYEALKIKEKNYGREHSEVARVLSNIASNKRYSGNYEEAEKLYQEAIDIWETQHETSHPYIAEGIHDLALIKNLRGRVQEADSLYRTALELNKTIYKGPHPAIAQNFSNLGTFLGKNGRYIESRTFLEDALQMRRTLYEGKNHPDVAESLNNLGRLEIETGNYDRAKVLLTEALEIDKSTYGEGHPYVGGDLKNLGLILKKEGDYQKAEEYFRKSLDIFEQRLPRTHEFVLETLTNLGEVMIHNNKIEEAGETLQELLDIQKESLDKENWKIARTKILLGISLFELNKFSPAESFLEEGYNKLKTAQGSDYEYTRKANEYLKKIQNRS